MKNLKVINRDTDTEIKGITGISWTIAKDKDDHSKMGYAGSIIFDGPIASNINNSYIMVISNQVIDNNLVCEIDSLQIINIGSGISVDDMSCETQVTYIAKGITGWYEKETN